MISTDCSACGLPFAHRPEFVPVVEGLEVCFFCAAEANAMRAEDGAEPLALDLRGYGP